MVSLILKILLFSFLFVSVVDAALLDSLTKEEKQWIAKHKEIPFSGDPNWLPFEAFDENGNYIGIVSDILKIIERKSGLKFHKMQTQSWEESLKLFQEKKVVMLTETTDSLLQKKFLFTQSFLKNPIVIIMKSENDYVETLEDLQNKSIVMIQDYGYIHKIKQKYPHHHFVEVQNINEGLKAVSQGRYDAILTTMALGSYMMTKMQLSNLAIVGQSGFQTEVGFVVLNEYAPLVGIINKVVQSIDEPTKQQILSKWISVELLKKVDYTLVWQIVIVFFIIIGGTLFWSLRLKREIKRRIILEEENERMLMQQAKHAALGEMMDAVAHQWKQPLNAIVMMNELLLMEYKEGTLDEKFLLEHKKDIDTQVEHLLNTLSEFRTFFRPEKKPEKFNLKASIDGVLLLVKDDLLKHTIDVAFVCDESIEISAIKNEFKHVILNIVSNARDAFVENNISNRKLSIIVKQHDEYLEIRIEDNAGGIPDEILPKIFESNFTSKEEGKGTGIGLYISQQIVHKMGATLEAYNIENGAAFRLCIFH